MSFSNEDRERVENFRQYVEDSVAADDRYGSAVREDMPDTVFATRFYEGPSCWFEFAVLPGNRQVRVGFFTTDPAVNAECEQVIAESGEPLDRFVGLAFEDAGLEAREAQVQHGREREAWFYATSLDLEDFTDLDQDEVRDKAFRMLEGYLIAFGPALGAEEAE